MVVPSYQVIIANHTVKPIHSIVWPRGHTHWPGPQLAAGSGTLYGCCQSHTTRERQCPTAPAPPPSHHKKAIPQVTDTCSQPPVLGELPASIRQTKVALLCGGRKLRLTARRHRM